MAQAPVQVLAEDGTPLGEGQAQLDTAASRNGTGWRAFVVLPLPAGKEPHSFRDVPLRLRFSSGQVVDVRGGGGNFAESGAVRSARIVVTGAGSPPDALQS